MSVIRTTWSKAYADNFGDIFRKKPEPKSSNVRIAGVCECHIHEHCAKCDPSAFCTKRGTSHKFCMKHQGGCGLHYNLQPDSKCECQPCDE